MKTITYYVALILGAPFFLCFFKIKISYEGGKKFNLPKGSIIISPHKTWLDAIMFSYLFFFNRIYYLAADWYKGFLKIFKPFMLALGAILVDINGKNYDFIDSCRKILGRGRNILVFPEGDYKENKHLFEFGDFKTGYLLIALKTGAPIVPIITDFSYGVFSRVYVKIGKPIYVEINQSDVPVNNQMIFFNDLIKSKCLNLFYQIKREKAEKIKIKYVDVFLRKGDIIIVKSSNTFRFGVYIDENNIIDLNYIYENLEQINEIKYTSLSGFNKNDKVYVRKLKPFKTRSLNEIESYLIELINQKKYSINDDSCLDFVNRVTLKI